VRNRTEQISDSELKIEVLRQIWDERQYQLSDFLPSFFEHLGYGWNRNYGRMRIAENAIQMHEAGWIYIESFNQANLHDLTPYIDFSFSITAKGFMVLKQANASKGRRKSAKAQLIAALVTQYK
jgi:hypothetical protein